MRKTVDYNTRKKAILSSTIKRHIKSAQPVASDDVAEEFALSSATIRNIFSELEDSGFIKHPHTSAGRIPTDRGYRYYVDFLIQGMELVDEEKQHIVKECKKNTRRADSALENTSSLISELTHYAGIVSFLECQDKFFYNGISRIIDQPEFRDADKIRLLVRVIEDKEQLLKIINRDFSGKVKVYIGQELDCPQMDNCSLVVSNYKRKNRLSGRVAVLGPTRMEYSHIIPTLEYVSDVLSEVLGDL